jgi:hypothetical protein
MRDLWRRALRALRRARGTRHSVREPPAAVGGWITVAKSASVVEGAVVSTELRVAVNGLEVSDAVLTVTDLLAQPRGLAGAPREALKRGLVALREHIDSAHWSWRETVPRRRQARSELSTPWPHDPAADELMIVCGNGRAAVTISSASTLPDISRRVTITAARALTPARGIDAEIAVLTRVLLEECDAVLGVSYRDAHDALTDDRAIRGAGSDDRDRPPWREATFQIGERILGISVVAVHPESALSTRDRSPSSGTDEPSGSTCSTKVFEPLVPGSVSIRAPELASDHRRSMQPAALTAGAG